MTTRPKNHPAVEAVARALCEDDNPNATLDGVPVWHDYIEMSIGVCRAFLDAMREPSDGMLAAAWSAEKLGQSRATWVAMHDQLRKGILND